MLKKKKVIFITIIVVIVISLTGLLYSTFATNELADKEVAVYNINLANQSNHTITLKQKEEKTIIYKIFNNNDGAVNYGIGYTGNSDGVEVKVYKDSKDEVKGLINKNEYKFVKLRLINTTDTEKTTILETILGYENGGELIIPSGKTLVTEEYEEVVKNNLAEYITNLYTNAQKTTVTNNNIQYNYAKEVSLMNDRLGSNTTDIDGGNIRYYGASPKNYIYFNCDDYSNQSSSSCELWRIIGVFDGKVKIIRDESIGEYAWDSGKNNWANASLKKKLNEEYYNGTGTYTSGKAITAATKAKIADSTWYLGGNNSPSVYSDQFYNYERNGPYQPSNGAEPGEEYKKEITSKIGLMYPSDYGYGADFEQCTQYLYNYNNTDCNNSDYLYKNETTWLISPNLSYSYNAFYVYSSGFVDRGSNVNYSYAVKPVLYLNSEQVIQDEHIGSSSDPFQLTASSSGGGSDNCPNCEQESAGSTVGGGSSSSSSS